MGRRHFSRSEPPPVTRPRVPDVARDKGVKLSRAERRAFKERRTLLFVQDGGRFTLMVPPGHPDHSAGGE